MFSDEAKLANLRENHKLALVTNGAPDLQREKIQSTKLTQYLDALTPEKWESGSQIPKYAGT